MTLEPTAPALLRAAVTDRLDDALTLVADPKVPAADRAALYAVLYKVQQTIRRRLGIGVRSADTPQAELIAHMESNGLSRMGPVSVKASGFDVAYPVNDPANWDDYGLQGELETFARIAPDYIRRIPEHYELDAGAMAQGIAAGDPVAKKLYRHAVDSGWRTEGGRRLSLAVAEGSTP